MTASLTPAPAGVTQTARPKGGYQVQPSYPSLARRQGIEGTSVLRVLVLADGRVGEVIVQSSAGNGNLDQAATKAVRQWKFEPARAGTTPVAMWVVVPVEFRLTR
jgi:protein TonB